MKTKTKFFKPTIRNVDDIEIWYKELLIFLNEKYSSMGNTKIQIEHFEKVWNLLPFNTTTKDKKDFCLKQWEKLCKEDINPTLELIEVIIEEFKILWKTQEDFDVVAYKNIYNNTTLFMSLTSSYLLYKIYNKKA
jgi:hypothetical protein